LHVGGRTGAEGARNFHGGASLTTFRQRDGIGASLVRQRLPRCPFGSIERSASRAFPSLLPKLRIPDAHASNELHQLQRKLEANEFVMRE
jgi:hypothetical protein